jgi:adenylosuccinate synthase
MPVTILIGAQWGDEGKGRVADWLASQSHFVARFSGGDNAGHTIFVGETVHKMRLIPSGILHPHVTCVLGNGIVLNPLTLLAEMRALRENGIDITPERLMVSTRAHLITPAHLAFDRANEDALGADKIGTTLRGIGPAYADKIARTGIRVSEMTDLESFGDLLLRKLEAANRRLEAMGAATIDVQPAVAQYVDAAAQLQPYLTDTTVVLNERLRAGDRILCEGAQGTLLDIDHGDYPYVTSSSASSGGALTGLGISPRAVDRIVGVAKGYATRVGSGPMPTELDGPVADHLRGTGENFWDEFGTVTRRPRRCGWFDAVLVRYAAAVNGFSELVLTKLDVMGGLEQVQMAVAYEAAGKRMAFPPATLRQLQTAHPIYETFEGWAGDITGVRRFDDLPAAARRYVLRIEEVTGIPVTMVSVGPEREQLIFR